jgi:hypothetical protein
MLRKGLFLLQNLLGALQANLLCAAAAGAAATAPAATGHCHIA